MLLVAIAAAAFLTGYADQWMPMESAVALARVGWFGRLAADIPGCCGLVSSC